MECHIKGKGKMKTEKEIREEIESLYKSRDSFVVNTKEWEMFNFGIQELMWVRNLCRAGGLENED